MASFRIVALVLAVSLASTGPASASLGLFAAVVYMCNAEKVSKHTVEACSTSQPQLTAEANNAMAKWRARVGTKAAAFAKECTRLAVETGASKGKAEMDAMLSEVLASIKNRANEDGKAYCPAALKELAQGSEMEEVLWRDVK